jgi:hypothetical protein
VASLSLDDFAYVQGNPPPQVVKMDIEGGEVLALPGMRRLLREAHPTVLLELHGHEAARAAWTELTGSGYRMYHMSNGYPPIQQVSDLGWKEYLVAR